MYADLAESFEITQHLVQINGVDFPYHLERRRVQIEVDPETNWTIVHLPLIVAGPVSINMDEE